MLQHYRSQAFGMCTEGPSWVKSRPLRPAPVHMRDGGSAGRLSIRRAPSRTRQSVGTVQTVAMRVAR